MNIYYWPEKRRLLKSTVLRKPESRDFPPKKHDIIIPRLAYLYETLLPLPQSLYRRILTHIFPKILKMS